MPWSAKNTFTSCALLKRYVDEPDSDRAVELLASDAAVVTGRHTVVEAQRNLARLLAATDATAARAAPAEELAAMSIIELDSSTAELAATVAEQTGVRALRLGTAMTFLTFDVRQAQAARALGFDVAGA